MVPNCLTVRFVDPDKKISYGRLLAAPRVGDFIFLTSDNVTKGYEVAQIHWEADVVTDVDCETVSPEIADRVTLLLEEADVAEIHG